MFTDPPKRSPVLEAALIALFTAIATKSVDLFFKFVAKKAKLEEDAKAVKEEEEAEEEEEDDTED